MSTGPTHVASASGPSLKDRSRHDAIVGCILGTAVGDALGLPYEGLSPWRASRLLGEPSRHRFFFGRGMISDDTEHTCMIALSLLDAFGTEDVAEKPNVDVFLQRLAARFRYWILALPAGVGKATARAGLKLWLGYAPNDSGVFSAGNGPAMRAAIFGAAVPDSADMLALLRVSSRLTHTDPKAEHGAVAVALAAQEAKRSGESGSSGIDANLWLSRVVEAINPDGSELVDLLRLAIESVGRGETTQRFASSLDLDRGVTGYTYHTVPVAIHAWLSHPQDFQSAVADMILCGGDADTTAAIVGGIVGAGVGERGIPKPLLSGILETPRSVAWMRRLGESLGDAIDTQGGSSPPRLTPIVILVRNVCFLMIVLFHGFRRLAPPYS